MRCLIVDDEPVAIDILKDYISRVNALELAGAYRNAMRALAFLKIHPVDLLFLDIQMPDLTGIQFLKVLDTVPLVIFTTAHSEYALESYDYEAVDYLLKPIEFERFLKAVDRAQTRFRSIHGKGATVSSSTPSNQKASILIKSGYEIHRIPLDDIRYVRGAGNYVVIVTAKREVMTLMRMKEILSLLPADRFVRIHKSYIIAMDHIDVIEKGRVIIGDITLHVGDTFKASFLEAVRS